MGIPAPVEVVVCECIWLTGGAQQAGPWLIPLIHTAGSEGRLYYLNGKGTAGLGRPCSAVLESWHLACV